MVLKHKTAVITGASSGVGKASAILMAEAGWNIIALGRDPDRSATALEEIRKASQPGARVEMITGDLALLSDVARMADAILDIGGPIHALCNNAGGVRNQSIITPEGNEATFAGNHLGHFLLTKRLMPTLLATAREDRPGSVRIIAVSSEGHRQAPPFDWDDLQLTENWVSGRNYCLAKLCNLLFTYELARRYGADSIIALAMHPGEANTNFVNHAVPEMQAYISSLEMIPPEVAGRTMAWLADSDEAAQMAGGYFFDCQALEAAPTAYDGETAVRLWDESEALLARAGY